jgi:hypothetical protein
MVIDNPQDRTVPAEPIHHRDQIDKPRLEADIRDIRAPDLSDPVDRDAAQQIRVNRVSGRRLAQAGFGIQGFQAHLPHQPPHALRIDHIAPLPQPGRHPADPIKRGGGVLLIKHPHEV